MPRTRVPTSTYRLQLTPSFGFADAARVVPYLHALGIGDLYVSPILRARTGSTHGYDVVDPTVLNPELGGKRGFEQLARALHTHDMGLLVDLVPNHMATGEENRWWQALLRGEDDGKIFDVTPGEPVVVPVLGETYEDALATGALRLARDRRGRFCVRYHEHSFPLASPTLRLIRLHGKVADALAAFEEDPMLLDELLEQQPYRLVHWRDANERVNYRRFFDINELAAVRVEDPGVFALTHELILGLVGSGAVTGLRIDHIDGLHDPLAYLRRLRRARVPYVVVEKILGPGEQLPDDWPVAGTTGYEVLNLINGLFVSPEGLATLGEAYRRRTGIGAFEAVLLEAKRVVLRDLFAADIARIVASMGPLPASEEIMADAVLRVSGRLPVYRTYGRAKALSEHDRSLIEHAVALAEGLDPAVRAFVKRVLLREEPRALEAADRWQQLTGPAMAKGFEDTALYRFNQLVSCNDVGGEPSAGAVDVDAFHAAMKNRMPGGLTTTSTHDTKRSEDVRARISVLSEMPDAFVDAVIRWRKMTDRHRRALGVPDPDEDWLLYQTLLGTWPLSDEQHADYPDRIADYMIKAAREAKRRTSWLDPDFEHEEALAAFIKDILGDGSFRADVARVAEPVAWHGMLNALTQTVLKVCLPGVPDVYQGSERWDLSLVDPDNRRPVDFEQRAAMLDEIDASADPADLLASWPDGRIKLFVLSRLLRFRRDHAALFERGTYVPLRARGPQAANVIAFSRRYRTEQFLVVVPRLTMSLSERVPLGARAWRDTRLVAPKGLARGWRDILTGAEADGLALAGLLSRMPVAVHHSSRKSRTLGPSDAARRLMRDAAAGTPSSARVANSSMARA